MNDRLQSNQREYLNFTSHILFISIYYIKQKNREKHKNIKKSETKKDFTLPPGDSYKYQCYCEKTNESGGIVGGGVKK